MAYNQNADLMSWATTRAFLMEIFGETNMNNPYTYASTEPLLDLATA